MNENAILTPRHNQICDLLIQGYATKEVAEELSITEKTADNHIQEIKKRYGVSKTSEVVILYLKNKFKFSMDLTAMQRRNRAIGFIIILIISEVYSFSEYCGLNRHRTRKNRTEIRCKLKNQDYV